MIDLCNTEEQMQKMTVDQLKKKMLERIPRLEGKFPDAVWTKYTIIHSIILSISILSKTYMLKMMNRHNTKKKT